MTSIRWLLDFILFYFILVTNITFYGLMLYPPSTSNGSNSAWMQSTNVIECMPPSFCLWPVRVPCLWAICGGASSISSDQGFLLKGRVKIYRPGRHSHISDERGETCAHSHSNTHTEMYNSTHTHTQTDSRGREVVVKWQAKGTEWGGARGCVTRGQGHAVGCACQR